MEAGLWNFTVPGPRSEALGDLTQSYLWLPDSESRMSVSRAPGKAVGIAYAFRLGGKWIAN